MTVNNVLTEIIRLHQITAGFFNGESGQVQKLKNNKLEALLEIIEDTDEKIIIWANWIYNIEEITNELVRIYGPSSVVNFYGANAHALRPVQIVKV